MTESKTSKRKLKAHERRDQAFQRRLGGWSFQRIGDELGVTRQAAHKMVMVVLKELNERTMESATELQRLELERLDTMNNAIWGAVLKGDVGAIDRAIRIQARRSALLGLDAPTKQESTNNIKGEVVIRYADSDNAAEDARGATTDKE